MDSTDIILLRRISVEEYERIPWYQRKRLERAGLVRKPDVKPPDPVRIVEDRHDAAVSRQPSQDNLISRCGRCGAWMLTKCGIHDDS